MRIALTLRADEWPPKQDNTLQTALQGIALQPGSCVYTFVVEVLGKTNDGLLRVRECLTEWSCTGLPKKCKILLSLSRWRKCRSFSHEENQEYLCFCWQLVSRVLNYWLSARTAWDLRQEGMGFSLIYLHSGQCLQEAERCDSWQGPSAAHSEMKPVPLLNCAAWVNPPGVPISVSGCCLQGRSSPDPCSSVFISCSLSPGSSWGSQRHHFPSGSGKSVSKSPLIITWGQTHCLQDIWY